MTKLTALVIGSGFAGKGHTEALRYHGVEVVGMVSRTRETVDAVAKELNIPYSSTDWEQALIDLQPSIVAVGTPGGAHYDVVMKAIDHGAHIYCDKPLAETAEKARALYEHAKSAGVKTAYAASYRYETNARYTRQLIEQGTIGEPQEIECVSHYNLEKLIPFGWSHRVEAGGGRLNNNFTHKLSIVQYMVDGTISQVTGMTRHDMDRAPIVDGVHDFRYREELIPDDDELEKVEWGDVDAEWSYTAMIELESPFAKKPVSALFKHSGLHPRFHGDYMSVYGEEGAIFMTDSYVQGDLYIYDRKRGWQQTPVPESITNYLPAIEDDTQRNWTAHMREFVAHIRGEAHEPYQTFEDGAHYQEIIERIRTGK